MFDNVDQLNKRKVVRDIIQDPNIDTLITQYIVPILIVDVIYTFSLVR